MRFGHSDSLGAFIAAPLFLSLAGDVGGAPFAALIFAPMILLLRRRWRLDWLAITTAGYFSVFVIGVAHCVVEHTVTTGIGADALFAVCGAVSGFCFWWVIGDVEKVASVARIASA